MLFQPLEKKLHQRYEATEGARKLARRLARATARTDEYEAAIRAARSEVYQAGKILQTTAGWRTTPTDGWPTSQRAEHRTAKAEIDADRQSQDWPGRRERPVGSRNQRFDPQRSRMKRTLKFVLLLGLAWLNFPAEEKREEGDPNRGMWKWANFMVLAVGLGYLAGKILPPMFTDRSHAILKDMTESQKNSRTPKRAPRKSTAAWLVWKPESPHPHSIQVGIGSGEQAAGRTYGCRNRQAPPQRLEHAVADPSSRRTFPCSIAWSLARDLRPRGRCTPSSTASRDTSSARRSRARSRSRGNSAGHVPDFPASEAATPQEDDGHVHLLGSGTCGDGRRAAPRPCACGWRR